MTKGLNLKSVKSENRSMILYLLNTYGSLSRKEIANKLSLTPAAVTKICNELIGEGFIKESGFIDANGKSGRHEVLLSLCLEDKYVLGVNAEKNAVTYSLATLKGEAVYLKKSRLYVDIDLVVKELLNFIDENSIDVKRVLAAGVCIIGSTEQNDFGVWKNCDIKDKFQSALGIPVVVENNVKAFAQGELIYGRASSSDSVLFFKWSAGIGSSIAYGGRVQSGNDNGIAEIGHYIVNTGGKKCRCGRYGCLETEVSSQAIINDAGGNMTLEDIVNSNDKDIIYMLDHKIDLVALALVNTATILNADSIVLFGLLFENERIIEKLVKQCVRYNKNFNESIIKISTLNKKREYIGCIAMCAKKYFFEIGFN